MIPLDSLVDSGEGVVEVDIVIVMLEAPPPRPSKILTHYVILMHHTICIVHFYIPDLVEVDIVIVMLEDIDVIIGGGSTEGITII